MPPPPPRTWQEVPAYVRAVLAKPFTKTAAGDPVLSTAADIAGWRAGPINETWGGPRPLSNLLIGAGLGSLGGYGLGRLAEEFLPERYFTPGELRKRTALLGGVLGAAPAAWQSYDNLRTHDWDPSALLAPWPKQGADKRADYDLHNPAIPRDLFNQMLAEDPYTPMKLRAATAGLVETADAISGGDGVVSPFDIARVAVGAGGGLVAGTIAGKTLGLLAGLTPDAQREIQRMGMWAGVIRAVVPPALGLRV